MRVSASICFWSLNVLSAIFVSASRLEGDLESQEKRPIIKGALRTVFYGSYAPVPTNETDTKMSASQVPEEKESETESDSRILELLKSGELSTIEMLNLRFRYGVQKFKLSKYLAIVVLFQLANFVIQPPLILFVSFLQHESGKNSMNFDTMEELYYWTVLISFTLASYIYFSCCFNY